MTLDELATWVADSHGGRRLQVGGDRWTKLKARAREALQQAYDKGVEDGKKEGV